MSWSMSSTVLAVVEIESLTLWLQYVVLSTIMTSLICPWYAGSQVYCAELFIRVLFDISFLSIYLVPGVRVSCQSERIGGTVTPFSLDFLGLSVAFLYPKLFLCLFTALIFCLSRTSLKCKTLHFLCSRKELPMISTLPAYKE